MGCIGVLFCHAPAVVCLHDGREGTCNHGEYLIQYGAALSTGIRRALLQSAALNMPSEAALAPSTTWRTDLRFAIILGVTMRLVLYLYGWWQLRVAGTPHPGFVGNWQNLATS